MIIYIYGMYTIYYILHVHYILYIVCTCIYYVFRIVFQMNKCGFAWDTKTG